ncbi:hypothetical protein [Natronosalvus amylolyticus]|uniref:hypothetical protein n=1 Tax=Natronosalvus amylolyticus TaxID=2961994 RepID=UPI0020CA1672|nr:hypothetical protein [Natronosalvus amylolyticus]
MGIASVSLSKAGAVVVVAGFAAFLVAVFVWPLAVSAYRRCPGLLFPGASLRLTALRGEVRDRGWRWLGRNLSRDKRALMTYWSFLWVVPLGLLVVVAVASLDLALVDRVQLEVVQHAWQAQLTITSLSFIVLIFLLEQTARTEYREGVIQEFFSSTRIMPVIYFTLGASGFVAYLYMSRSGESVAPAIADATFITFLGTVLGIGYVYYRVARLIFFDPVDAMAVAQVQRGIDLKLRDQDRQTVSQAVLERMLPDFVGIGVDRDGRLYMAQELDLEGYIADINLSKLVEVCRAHADRFEGDTQPTLLLNLGLGEELQPGIDVVSVADPAITPEDVPNAFAAELADAIHCSSDRPWKTGDRLIERNMGRIGEETRAAITDLSPTRLERYLGLYIDLLQHATRVNRQLGAVYGGTPVPVSNLINQIYREFYHILDGAAQTGSADLITTVRGEFFRLALAQHRQQEPHLFDKSIGLYASYYHVLAASPAIDQKTVNGLLSSLDNIKTMLAADLGGARSVDAADHAATDLAGFYDTLEQLLRLAIEEGDGETFNNVWNLGDDEFVMVRPESRIHDLQWQLEETDDEAEQERLEQELAVKRKQQDAVDTMQSRFEESRFVAAAWAYREIREGNLAEPVFQEMFRESFKTYRFSTLVDIYYRLCTGGRLDFFRWESEDADVFKGVQASQPAVHSWLQVFFCAMGLLFLDVDEYDTDTVPASDNPLVSSAIDRTSYPDLWDTIDSISADELALTGVAEDEFADLEERKAVFLVLHEQMEELLNRREDERVIDANLDPDKVADFTEDYVSTFTDQFMLRTVFKDLGWLDTRPYDDETDVDGFGYNVFYPKRGFIPDPPAQFIHHLDRRVQNHVDRLLEEWLGEDQDHLIHHQIDAYESIPDKITSVCRDHQERGKEPRAILTGGFRARRNLADSNVFHGEYHPSDDVTGGFAVDDAMIPVYDTQHSGFDAIVLAGADQPATLTEYNRDDAPVYVDIQKVTRQLLEELNPEQFDDLTDDELRDHLQKIRFRALYYGHFDATDIFGATITVTD